MHKTGAKNTFNHLLFDAGLHSKRCEEKGRVTEDEQRKHLSSEVDFIALHGDL